MEFKLHISTNFGYAVRIPSANVGTKYIGEIRSSLGCELPLNRIHIKESFYQDPKLTVDCLDVFKLPFFEQQHEVKILVENGALNQFAFLDWSANRDPETGEVLRVDIAWFLDTNSVINALINGDLEYTVYNK